MKRAILACLIALLTAAPAQAAVDQESLLQDDPLLLHPRSDADLERTFAIIKGLGVDRIRVSVFWNLIAPRPDSRHKPSFGERGPSWPDAYPRGTWDRYDDIVLLASRYQIGLLFNVTGPAPNWAAGKKGGDLSVHKPKVRQFRAFVTAVGRRYSGTWTPEGGAPYQPPPPTLLPIGPFQSRVAPEAKAAQAGGPLPRVAHWSLWNEPNFPSWLKPVYKRTRIGRVPASPHRYRSLVRAARRGLRDSGHGSDVILLGETAPRGGTLHPDTFIRELYCLDADYRPFRRTAARVRSCPVTRAKRRSFGRRHAGLFESAGWAHHGYSLDDRPRWRKPTWRDPTRRRIPLGATRRLTRVLDRSQFAWGSPHQMDIWITEYGYQTVPDPYTGISLTKQAEWTSWAEYVAYKNPRIAVMSQFLLSDDSPDARFPEGDFRYWRTWQSGLVTASGHRKPAFEEYPFPIHVSRKRRGRRVKVFGIARPAPEGTVLTARIQGFRPGADWVTLKKVRVTNVKSYVSTRVRPRRSHLVRILWTDPASGASVVTRGVALR